MQVPTNYLSTTPTDNWTFGREGEEIIREYLKANHIHYMQADILAEQNGKWYLFEIKHQAIYEPPPFYGHGLPSWQIEARLKFQKAKDIRALLFVVDKDTGVVYWQYMDILMNGEKYQTTGDNPRLIFPLKSYHILNK